MMCPSSARAILYLSNGRGAGPSTFRPVLKNPLPWQGHLNLFLDSIQLGVHPRWVQIVLRANSRFSSSLTIHTPYLSLYLRSTVPGRNSEGLSTLNLAGGSNRTLGKKNLARTSEIAPTSAAKPLQAAVRKNLRREVFFGSFCVCSISFSSMIFSLATSCNLYIVLIWGYRVRTILKSTVTSPF